MNVLDLSAKHLLSEKIKSYFFFSIWTSFDLLLCRKTVAWYPTNHVVRHGLFIDKYQKLMKLMFISGQMGVCHM